MLRALNYNEYMFTGNKLKSIAMKNNFIELTERDGTKILINAFHIGWIEPNKSGSTIIFNLVNYSLPKKVQESYDVIKALTGSMNFPK